MSEAEAEAAEAEAEAYFYRNNWHKSVFSSINVDLIFRRAYDYLVWKLSFVWWSTKKCNPVKNNYHPLFFSGDRIKGERLDQRRGPIIAISRILKLK